jgi:hypothetical protein
MAEARAEAENGSGDRPWNLRDAVLSHAGQVDADHHSLLETQP